MGYNNNIEEKLSRKRFLAMLKPSWLSSLVAVLAGLFVTGGVILAFSFNSSQIQHQLISYESTSAKQPALTLPGQAPPNSAVDSLQNTWPLIAFWAVIGLVVYFVAETVYGLVSGAEEFSKELNYVHAKRTNLITSAVLDVVFRLILSTIWLVVIDLCLKKLLPHSIDLSQRAATEHNLTRGIIYGVESFLIILISVQVNIDFLRLILKKTRVFSSSEYLDV